MNRRFFLTGISGERRNTICISSSMDLLWGKRFIQNRVNPYVSPPNGLFLFHKFINGVAKVINGVLVAGRNGIYHAVAHVIFQNHLSGVIEG